MDISSKLKKKLAGIPEVPGIYKMLDSKGRIIYIGKSKCLKKRVRTYFAKSNKWHKVEKLLAFIDDIDYQVTDTHLEACLLECKLIKEIKPIFNSQMKNDESYVYLKVADEFNPHKTLSVEASRSDKSFGPFRQRYRLYEIIDSLHNLFPIDKDSTGYKFEYNPLPKDMVLEEFNTSRELLIDIFSNTSSMDLFIEELMNKMQACAQSYKYETASKYRDIIKGLNFLNYRISDYNLFLSQDYLLQIPTSRGLKLFLVSKGSILFSKEYKDPSSEDIKSFINIGYKNKEISLDGFDEKSAIDFHDIIYSEMKALGKGSYKILS